MVLLLIIVGTLRTGDYPAFINGLVRGIGILFLVGGILSVGLHAASTVAREREERTLDGLRTLPISQQEILWAKLRASLRRGRWCVIPLGFTLILGGIVVGIGLGLLPLVIVYSATLLVVAGTFGLWLSVRCHTVSRAMLYFMFTLTAFSILPPIIASLVGDAIKDRPGSVRREMIEAASPMLTWWRLTANESERTRYQDGFEGVDLFPMTKARFLSVTGAIVALWVVSLIFWGHSQRLLAKQE
jgi:ABC-type transport system involved in multi-copper enzyme maturation permease subunit